jgi:hypothetical protein
MSSSNANANELPYEPYRPKKHSEIQPIPLESPKSATEEVVDDKQSIATALTEDGYYKFTQGLDGPKKKLVNSARSTFFSLMLNLVLSCFPIVALWILNLIIFKNGTAWRNWMLAHEGRVNFITTLIAYIIENMVQGCLDNQISLLISARIVDPKGISLKWLRLYFRCSGEAWTIPFFDEESWDVMLIS